MRKPLSGLMDFKQRLCRSRSRSEKSNRNYEADFVVVFLTAAFFLAAFFLVATFLVATFLVAAFLAAFFLATFFVAVAAFFLATIHPPKKQKLSCRSHSHPKQQM